MPTVARSIDSYIAQARALDYGTRFELIMCIAHWAEVAETWDKSRDIMLHDLEIESASDGVWDILNLIESDDNFSQADAARLIKAIAESLINQSL